MIVLYMSSILHRASKSKTGAKPFKMFKFTYQCVTTAFKLVKAAIMFINDC